MDLRGLATSTKRNYVHWVYQLAKYYHRSLWRARPFTSTYARSAWPRWAWICWTWPDARRP